MATHSKVEAGQNGDVDRLASDLAKPKPVTTAQAFDHDGGFVGAAKKTPAEAFKLPPNSTSQLKDVPIDGLPPTRHSEPGTGAHGDMPSRKGVGPIDGTSVETPGQGPETTHFERKHMTGHVRAQLEADLRKSHLDGVTPAGIHNLVDTADKLTTAKPADREKLFAEGLQRFQKDNPNAQPTDYSRELNTIFERSKASAGMRTDFMGSFGVTTGYGALRLLDSNMRSPENPKGIAGTVFASTDKLEAQAYQGSQRINQMINDALQKLPVEQRDAVRANLEGELGRLKGEKPNDPTLLSQTFPDSSRARTPDLPSSAEQIQGAKADIEKYRQYLGTRTDTNKFAEDVVGLANQVAFSPGSQEGASASRGFQKLLQKYPEADQLALSMLLQRAEATATNSDDFLQNTNSDQTEMWDVRLKTQNNPNGRMADIVRSRDPASLAAADIALSLTPQYRQELADLPPDASDEQRRDFVRSIEVWRHFTQR